MLYTCWTPLLREEHEVPFFMCLYVDILCVQGFLVIVHMLLFQFDCTMQGRQQNSTEVSDLENRKEELTYDIFLSCCLFNKNVLGN